MPRFGENRQPPLRSRGGFSEIERANDRDDDTESSVGYDSDNWIQDAGRGDARRLTDRERASKYHANEDVVRDLNDAERVDQGRDAKARRDERRKPEHNRVDFAMVSELAVAARMAKLFLPHSKRVISPRGWLMRKWDFVMIFLLVFTALVTPVEVAFMTTKINALFFINRVVDLNFLADIVLNFHVAIPDPVNGQLIFHQPTIARHYLRGWLTVDVVSVMPYDLISLLTDNSSLGSLKVFRVLRLLRLMKLLRMLRSGRVFARMEVHYNIDYTALDMFKFALLACMSSHWMGCAFGMVADIEDSETSWLHYTTFRKYLVSGKLARGEDPSGIVTYGDLYVAAFYWAAMTMTTIGYGDIVPSTTTERVFVIVAMLLGAFIYGYIIGAVGNAIRLRGEKKGKFYELMNTLNSFFEEAKIKTGLRIRMREYFKYKLSRDSVLEQSKLLDAMSPSLRAEITLQTNTWIAKVPFFQKCPEGLIIALTLKVRETTYPPQEKIIVPGDFCDRMFMVRKGVAIARSKIMTTGSVFCDECLYKEGKVAYSAHSVTFVDLYSLDRDVLVTALNYFPDQNKHFRVLSLKRIFNDEIMAYTKAYRALRDRGVDAEFHDSMDERPAFFLVKLRTLYGVDGAGLRPWEKKSYKRFQEVVIAAKFIQRLFRARRERIEVQASAIESRVTGVFSKKMRKFDPENYVARAIDVLHHRQGSSLWKMHQKFDAKLTGQPVSNLSGEGVIFPGLKFSTRKPEPGECLPMYAGGKGGRGAAIAGFYPGGAAGGGGGDRHASAAASVHAAASLAEDAAASIAKGVEAFREEMREAFGTSGVAGVGTHAARADAIESRVKALAKEIADVGTSLAKMTLSDNDFQQKTQIAILEHLGKAQAQIAKDVAEVVKVS